MYDENKREINRKGKRFSARFAAKKCSTLWSISYDLLAMRVIN
jgi:hypothetical protein